MQVLELQTQGVAAVRRAWAAVNPAMIRRSWDAAAQPLTRTLRSLQWHAALAGSTYGALTLAQQGTYVAPSALAIPSSFVGWLVDDDSPLEQVDLSSVVSGASVQALTRIKAGDDTRNALAAARRAVETVAVTAVADAARQAASVDVVTRPGVGYVRMLNPPSCARCVVLAGRFYRWNAGFRRHPNCDCVHVLATSRSTAGAIREGLITDPYEYFNSLSEADQDRLFTRSGAQAIRDGADVYQVVNSRRGVAAANSRRRMPNAEARRHWTLEGASRRGHYYSQQGGRRPFRLTPEGVYAKATSREDAIRLLTENEYILPDGQVPGGSLRGARYEGYGALGHGGDRRAAVDAVLRARESGVRNPSSRYTMTAAERRVADARWNWDLARMGIDPTSPGAVELRGGSQVRGTIRPAPPGFAAEYERNYRYLLARNGQVY